MGAKLYVGNLAYAVTDDRLEQHFAQQGSVVSARVITDKFSGRSKGFGFVEMASDAEAAKALNALNGTEFEGRNIVVSEARGIGGNHPIVYRHFGVEPAEAKMLVVKTASNWQYYRPMISEVIRVNTPGATMSPLHDFNWKLLPRPIYPLDDLQEWQATY